MDLIRFTKDCIQMIFIFHLIASTMAETPAGSSFCDAEATYKTCLNRAVLFLDKVEDSAFSGSENDACRINVKCEEVLQCGIAKSGVTIRPKQFDIEMEEEFPYEENTDRYSVKNNQKGKVDPKEWHQCQKLLDDFFKHDKKKHSESKEKTDICPVCNKPFPPISQDQGTSGKVMDGLKFLGKTAAITGAVIGGVTFGLPILGFSAAGITAGSIAATYQGAALGGSIAAGGVFSTLQAIGAAGLTAATKLGIASVTALGVKLSDMTQENYCSCHTKKF